MRVSYAVVRDGTVAEVGGDPGRMPAASLVKPVVGHLALALVDDLDAPIDGAITVRHVLSHTTGLPNWQDGALPVVPLRPPGVRWGYSGEGFALLVRHLEARTGAGLDRLAAEAVFGPLGMDDSRVEPPEPGRHGYRPLVTTAADYGRFLAHVLGLDDERWRPQVGIDPELAWGAGWGLELGPPVWGWQWGLDEGASHIVLGCPATGDGIVVLTDSLEDGRAAYRAVVERELGGDHPALRVEHNPTWLALVAG
jgi:CubicO group peptidase (beta-lactamase class C family)